MTRSPEFDAWIQRAREADILEEALARGAVLKRHSHEWTGPCPTCGGNDRFGLNITKQIFICRGAAAGDVIRMVEHIEGLPFLAAVESINGEPAPGRKRREISDDEIARIRASKERADAQREARLHEQEDSERRNRARAGDIWRASVPITGTLAEVYLNTRGIPTLPEGWPECFRFHPAIPYPDREKLPALICRVDNQRGVPKAIWRIYLAPDGRGKASVPKSKLGLGPAGGGAVRIGGIGPHLGLAEGVETALGAWMLTGRKFPIWAALSTSGIVGFNVPKGVGRLTLFPDGDRGIRKRGDQFEPSEPPGRAAARRLQERLHSQSIPCVIASEPPAGADYNDLWVASQRSAA